MSLRGGQCCKESYREISLEVLACLHLTPGKACVPIVSSPRERHRFSSEKGGCTEGDPLMEPSLTLSVTAERLPPYVLAARGAAVRGAPQRRTHPVQHPHSMTPDRPSLPNCWSECERS